MQLPWRAAPRAALSSPLTLLVTFVAALLLSFVGAAAVLHSDAAGNAAVTYQASRLCEQSVPPVINKRKGDATTATQILGAARARAGAHGFGAVIGTVYTSVSQVEINGKRPWGRFGYRDGAMDHVTVLSGGGRDGLWVPRSIADEAGVTLGQRLSDTLPPVTAIYQDFTDPMPSWWCTERDQIMPSLLGAEGRSSAVILLPTLDTFITAFTDALPTPGRRFSSTEVSLSVQFPIDRAPQTVGEAQDLVARGDALAADLRPQLEPEGAIASNYFTSPVRVARTAENAVLGAVAPLTLVSLLVGLAGVGAVAVQWCQRRRAELRLLWARGASPAALGGRAMLELGAPLLAGALLGLLAARVGLSWYAPTDRLDDGTTLLAALGSLLLLVCSVAVVGVVTANWAHRTLQAGGATTRAKTALLRKLPWELVTATLAYLVWRRLDGRPTTLAFGQPLPDSDPIGLAFPLFVVLTTALVAVRLAGFALRASHRVNLWRSPATQLAVRRLAASTGSVLGILLVGVLAVGTLVVGVGVADAQEQAMDTKAGMFVGADTTVQVPSAVGVDPTKLPAAVIEKSTVVGVLKTDKGMVLVLDPATFTTGAWLGDRDIDDVTAQLAKLASPGSGGITALSVGAASTGQASLPRIGSVTPVEHLASFPLIGTGRGWVVSRAALPDLTDIDVWQVWSTTPADALVAQLDAAGVHHLHSRSKAQALDGLPFLTVKWTFDFVTALGLVLAIVAAAALLLAVEVRRRQNALAGSLATRMGLRQRTLVGSHLIELGSIAGVSVAAGATAGAVCAWVSAPLLDPSPWLRPVAGAPNLVPLLSGTMAATAVVVAAACWAAVRSVTTASVGELIRG